MNCPDRSTLLAFRTGELSEADAGEMISHISACPNCQGILQTFGDADDTLIAKLRSPAVADPYLDEPQRAELMARAMAIVAGSSPVSDQRPAETQVPVELSRLGEYELLAKLGEGGMGAVYKARQTRLKKIVALKVLPKERTTDPRAVTRFEREMEAVGQLSHPNIVQAYDARDIEGTAVLVMEYVDGKDLAQVLQCVKIAADLRCLRSGPPDSPGTAIRPRAWPGASRHQALEPDADSSPRGNVKILDLGLALLRIGSARGRRIDLIRLGHGHGRLHGPGTGFGRPRGGHPGRHLLAGLHALQAADRSGALQRAAVQDPRRETGGPLEGDASAGATTPQRRIRRVGRGDRADDGQVAG